jgi:hypothetical protein
MNALGALKGPFQEFMLYGMSPSTGLPGFLPGLAPDYLDRASILPFALSTSIDASITLKDPSLAVDGMGQKILAFDRVISARVSAPRTVDGVTLTTAIQAITKNFVGQMQFDAPLALGVQLGGADLSTADGVMFDRSSPGIPLTWSIEPSVGTPILADDFIVTLFEVTPTGLAQVRIYQVLTNAVTIDGSLLQVGHEYVFSITARKGLGNTKQGDYRVVSYPFVEATTFPATFHIRS